MDDIAYDLPSTAPDTGLFALDTAELFGALIGEGGNKRSLSHICDQLHVPTQYLHNAGNDAHVCGHAVNMLMC